MENNILNVINYFNMSYEVDGDKVIVYQLETNEKQSLNREKLLFLLRNSNDRNQVDMKTNLALVELWENNKIDIKLNEAGEIMVANIKKPKRWLFGRKR